MSASKNHIITPLIRTITEGNFKLYENVYIKNLQISNFPDDDSQKLISLTHKSSDHFAAIHFNSNSELGRNDLIKHSRDLREIRFVYWLSSGVPLNSSFSIVINNGKAQIIEESSHCFDPAAKMDEKSNYGIGKENIVYFKRLKKRMIKVEKLNHVLSPFFELTDLAFSSPSENSRIALFVSAIESILLPGVTTEITYQIALRSAILSGKSKGLSQRKESFHKFKKIYQQRSKFLHGER